MRDRRPRRKRESMPKIPSVLDTRRAASQSRRRSPLPRPILTPTELRVDPMFLPGVEAGAKPGPYLDAIVQMRQAGMAEYPQIWHLFAYLPEATEHLARFTQAILRGPA